MHLIRRTDESNRCQLGIKTLEMVSCQNRQLSPFLILPIVNLNLFAFFIKKKKNSLPYFLSRKREYTTERITSDCQIRKSKTVLDCRFQATDSWLQGLDSRFLSVELGFRIPIVTGIPDSLSCIPDTTESQDSRFTRKHFWIPDSTGKNFQDSGVRISLRGGKEISSVLSQ